jgi:hypothetical protein
MSLSRRAEAQSATSSSLAVISIASIFVGLSAAVAQQTYTYTTIDPPGSTYTIATTINASSKIVGYYQDINGIEHGSAAPAGETR